MLQRFQNPHVRQADRRTIRLDRIQKLKTELWPLVTASGLMAQCRTECDAHPSSIVDAPYRHHIIIAHNVRIGLIWVNESKGLEKYLRASVEPLRSA